MVGRSRRDGGGARGEPPRERGGARDARRAATSRDAPIAADFFRSSAPATFRRSKPPAGSEGPEVSSSDASRGGAAEISEDELLGDWEGEEEEEEDEDDEDEEEGEDEDADASDAEEDDDASSSSDARESLGASFDGSLQ